ncbi:MAG: LuxR family transcriptional regulator, regulator of acetate metabolism, partial [Solirubrobacteraceae bacterium]|nr:LuxR family transcriptional regulator, regulator of acetate metabolism [Solirubrobacteraceae bacterium]
TQILALQRHLHGAGSVTALFGRAAEAARAECGFDRAVVLCAEDGVLSAVRMPALDHHGSDVLRRELLATPPELQAGGLEAEFIRLSEGGRGELIAGRSVLQAEHGLREFALGALTVESRVLALLVLDRAEPAVTFSDRTVVQGFCQLVTGSLERLLQRMRVAAMAAEVRYLTVSASALLREAADGEIGLDAGSGLRSPSPAAVALDPRLPGAALDVFTRRELSVVRLLVEGRCNRDIAEALHIAPDTVKKYVSRVMRKVGASNRADAAVRCLQLLG